jgi:two-component system nitrate/nitrite response regulator NarL
MIMERKIRLLLVDDHSLFRESLGRLLASEKDMELAGEARSVAEAIAALDTCHPDIVLLDFDLGDIQKGLDFIEQAKQRNFPGRILMVTAGMDDADTVRVLQQGVSGIFLKHNSPGMLIAVIHKVFQGELLLDTDVARLLISGASSGQANPQTHPVLNEREQSVLRCVFEGLTNKEIASKLNFSESYVKALLQQLFQKTGARNRSQLVRIALERKEQYAPELDKNR